MKRAAKMIFLIFFLVGTDAYSCDCSKDTVDEGMSNSDLVFGASVVGARINGMVLEIDIDSFAPLKGSAAPLKKMTTPSSSEACGFVVSVPERYVFFASKDGTISKCGASRKLVDPELGVLAGKVIRVWRSTTQVGAN